MKNFLTCVEEIQKKLYEHKLDGWLLYDFKGSNPIALSLVELSGILSRRWFCLIPAQGSPRWLIHAIEENSFQSKHGEKLLYRSWQELAERLSTLLHGMNCIAMEYSPLAAIPSLSRVDAGTLDLIKKDGVRVVSSVDILQHFIGHWGEKGYESHIRAARALGEIVQETFAFIGNSLKKNKKIGEINVQKFICKLYKERSLITDHPPIVATGVHSGMPHYVPSKESSYVFRKGGDVLLDIWAKENHSEAIYADITWVGFIGEPSQSYKQIWQIVKSARDSVVEEIKKRKAEHRPIQGWEADQVARDIIKRHGYENAFLHRTGHNIGESDHGMGVNLDNFETHDTRELLPGSGFSVEPGIYLPEFGIRSEIDVYIGETGVEITTPVQEDIVVI